MIDFIRLTTFSALALTATVFIACGSDDEEAIAVNTGGGAGGEGGSDAAGAAGEAAGGSSGGSPSGTGGTPPATGGTPPALACDTAACQIPGGMLQPCCISDTQCGIDLGGTCTDPNQFLGDAGGAGFLPIDEETVVEDSSCPGLTAMGFTLPGCCDLTGVCGGSTAPFAGSGFVPSSCLTPTEIGDIAGSFGGGGGPFDAGAAQPCAYPGGSTTTDAGGSTTTDAGGSGDGG